MLHWNAPHTIAPRFVAGRLLIAAPPVQFGYTYNCGRGAPSTQAPYTNPDKRGTGALPKLSRVPRIGRLS
jgi:hypothetical protein